MIHIVSSCTDIGISCKNTYNIPSSSDVWIHEVLQVFGVEYAFYNLEVPGVAKLSRYETNSAYKESISSLENTSPEDIIFISSVSQEFDLSGIHFIENTIFLDIRGLLYGEDGEKQRFDCRSIHSLAQIIIQVTTEEFSYLDHRQDTSHTFIVMNGGSSVQVFGGKQDFSIPVVSGDFTYTAGADEIFFAAFIIFYEKMGDIRKSIIEASCYVYRFLSEKNKLDR